MDQLLLILAIQAYPGMVSDPTAAMKPRRPADEPGPPDLLRSQIADVENQGNAASGEA